MSVPSNFFGHTSYTQSTEERHSSFGQVVLEARIIHDKQLELSLSGLPSGQSSFTCSASLPCLPIGDKQATAPNRQVPAQRRQAQGRSKFECSAKLPPPCAVLPERGSGKAGGGTHSPVPAFANRYALPEPVVSRPALHTHHTDVLALLDRE